MVHATEKVGIRCGVVAKCVPIKILFDPAFTSVALWHVQEIAYIQMVNSFTAKILLSNLSIFSLSSEVGF